MVADRTPHPTPDAPHAPDAASPVITPHERHVGTIAVWLAERSSADLSVDVVTGPNRVPIARGHYIDMEAHPRARGVYRLIFDNSLAGADPPLGEPWVTVGAEVVDVAAGDSSLIIDKGVQRVEVQVMGAVAPAWAPASSPAVAPPIPAPSSGRPAVRSGGDSILQTYAPTSVVAIASAPLYQNAALLGSKRFGPAELEVVGGDLRVTARRMSGLTSFLVLTGIVVLVFAVVPLAFYAVLMFNQNVSNIPADPSLVRSDLRGAAMLGAVGAAFYLLGFLTSRGRKPETLLVPLTSASGKRSGRVFMVKLPVGARGKKRRLILKPAGKADRARLQQLVAQLRG